ncbi:hypothetical protein [Pontibacter oryzae]|uniref:Uncharacterized protein n=1 Tax=Pontibacter oryzae TaxID=2304593 RepID=A0A399SHR3_9BACT|nr:hypothetical protein [Pontibacter oryzae]RIJ41387.1 hypothetical protein D1627_04910 [Pontibacter oryzae]
MARAEETRKGLRKVAKHPTMVPPNLEKWAKTSVTPSGCMRGNDRPANNGSASAGIYPKHLEPVVPDPLSYKDFISMNYGYKPDGM